MPYCFPHKCSHTEPYCFPFKCPHTEPYCFPYKCSHTLSPTSSPANASTQMAKSAKESKSSKTFKDVHEESKSLKTIGVVKETITTTTATQIDGMSFGPLSISQIEEMEVPPKDSMSFWIHMYLNLNEMGRKKMILQSLFMDQDESMNYCVRVEKRFRESGRATAHSNWTYLCCIERKSQKVAVLPMEESGQSVDLFWLYFVIILWSWVRMGME